MRLRLSLLLASIAGSLSKSLLRKSGATIPGKVLLALYPQALQALSRGRTLILVSGTNGKTSTTKVLTQIISQLGTTLSNGTGSNLDRGSASALMQTSEYAVLEVDELYLAKVIEQTKPVAVLLLNLSRDQLHRMHEVKKVADRWRKASEQANQTTFIGDVDDPFIAYVLEGAKKNVRVSFGGRNHADGAVCPNCGKYLKWAMANFSCTCGLASRNYDSLQPAGSAAHRNAILANITGSVLNAPTIIFQEKNLERSLTKNFEGRTCSVRLVKNPASWSEALTTIKSENVILILNARQVDGIDTSWLWDVSFEELRGRNVTVCGERAIDLSYRLHVAGINSVLEKNFDQAMAKYESNQQIEVLAAYTAFFSMVSA